MDETLSKLGRLIRDPGVQVDVTGFIFALVVSTIVGALVSALYQIFYESRATGSQVHRSFLLLSPSITAVFIAVQFSLPLSLGLLGALSIIRFRTPIKEPEEVGFIMLLIACAVVCATFQFLLLFVLLGLVLLVLAGQRLLPVLGHGKTRDGVVLVSLDNTVDEDATNNIVRGLNARFKNGKVDGVSYTDSLVTIQYSFSGLNGKHMDGIQRFVKELGPVQKVNVYFNN